MQQANRISFFYHVLQEHFPLYYHRNLYVSKVRSIKVRTPRIFIIPHSKRKEHAEDNATCRNTLLMVNSPYHKHREREFYNPSWLFIISWSASGKKQRVVHSHRPSVALPSLRGAREHSARSCSFFRKHASYRLTEQRVSRHWQKATTIFAQTRLRS